MDHFNSNNDDDDLIQDDVVVSMRIVQVAECAPARQYGTKEKITMLTFLYGGEVEQPLMLNLRDTKRLAVDLMVSLATHGNKTAQAIIDNYFHVDDDA